MQPIAVLILIIIGILALAFFASRFRFLRATRQIMQLFNRANAFDAQNAVAAEMLGVQKRPFYMNMGMRDFKKMAFDSMVQANVIQELETEEGIKYFVSRDYYERIVNKG